MKSKLLSVLVVIFFVFDLGLLGYYYQFVLRRPAQSAPVDQPENPYLPTVRATQLEVDREQFTKNAVAQGKVTLVNLDNHSVANLSLVSDIYLALKNSSLDMVSEQVEAKTISLKPKETKAVPFIHKFSNRINSGNYFVTVNIMSQTGLPLTQLSSRVRDVVGMNRFLEIDWRSSKIISAEGQELSPLAGPNFKPKSSPRIRLTVANPHAFPITAAAKINLFERAATAGVKPVDAYQEDLITFAANSEQQLEFTLPAKNQPESYLTQLQFIDQAGHPASGLQQFRWVVSGPSGKILAVKATTGEKFFGQVKTTVEASVVGPATSTDWR